MNVVSYVMIERMKNIDKGEKEREQVHHFRHFVVLEKSKTNKKKMAQKMLKLVQLFESKLT